MAAADIRTAQFSVLLLEHNPGLRQDKVSAALGIKTANFVPLLDGAGTLRPRGVPADPFEPAGEGACSPPAWEGDAAGAAAAYPTLERDDV